MDYKSGFETLNRTTNVDYKCESQILKQILMAD